MTSTEGRRELARQAISRGGAIAVSAVSAALGALSGDPAIAVFAGVGGEMLRQVVEQVGAEVNDRFLGEREQVRVGAALAFAIRRADENRQRGKVLRGDDFFHQSPNERSTAEEILEGVLLAAQQEHEEKKVKFIGNLYANIAYSPSVDRAYANALIYMAETLTWRQLCLLHLFQNDPTPFVRGRGRFDLFGVPSQSGGITAIFHEIFDLDLRGLISMHEIDPRFSYDPNLLARNVSFHQVAKPRTVGEELYRLMDLGEISEDDLEPIRQILPQYRLTWEDLRSWYQANPGPPRTVDR